MTICIGTICEKSKYAIFACDRMLTEDGLSIEFEHDEPKYDVLSPNCVGLSAGEVTPTAELFERSRDRIAAKAHPNMESIADEVARSFSDIKKKRFEEKYLRPRNLTMDEYMQVQRNLNENVILRLERALETEKFNLSILLVGIDKHAHLIEVSDPGHCECFDKIGFNAIGSGLPHAISTFISYNFSPKMDLNRALYITYEAKRNAERAPGVGHITDIGVIGEQGLKILSEEIINQLDNIYQRKTKLFKEQLESINEDLGKLKIKSEDI